MRYPASEKLEIIRLVERSYLPIKQTLDRCCQSNANFSPNGWGLSRSCRYLAPFGQCGRTVLLETFPRDEMSVEVEMIEN
jgi:hypothetical protein